MRSNAQLGRLLGIGTNGLDRAVANRDNRRSANTLDLGKNRLVLKIGRQQLTVGVKRHKDVLLKDGLAVGCTHALNMQQQRVLLQAKELHLVLTCRHNLAIDHMCARLHAIIGTQRGKRLQRRSVELAVDVRRGNKGAAALLLNQVAIGAQLLDGAAHRNAAHVVLLG